MKNNIIALLIFVFSSTVFAQTAGDPFDYTPVKYSRENFTEEMHISRGGQLYDNWMKTNMDVKKPQGDHSLWKVQNTNKRTGYATYRCKECHGWDYKGKEGAYRKGSHYTGFQGVYGSSQSMSVTELKDVMKGVKNREHDFSRYLSEDDISDLSLFLKKGVIDLTTFINSNGLPAGGDIKAGRDFYSRNCMLECHGNDGTAINFKSKDSPEFIGTVANKNPWELIHKVRVGQPGTRMSSGIINKWSYDDLLNVLSYARTLPKEQPRQGWFDRLKISLGISKSHKSIIVKESRGFGPKLEP
jgi:thiosulfate dehydrogenase